MNYVVGLAGQMRSGKDTVADIFGRLIQENHLDFQINRLSFAEPIKSMLQVGLGLARDQVDGGRKDVVDNDYGCTPRHMMQSLGTEWGRELIHQDIWRIALMRKLKFDSGWFNIITDVRFDNEAEWIRDLPTRSCIIHIDRFDRMDDQGHTSEAGVQTRQGDFIIDNRRRLYHLHIECAHTLKRIMEMGDAAF